MSQSDYLPDANVMPGALSAADVGMLTNNVLGANVSVVNREYRLLYANAYYAASCATTQAELMGKSLFELHDEAQMHELEPYFQRVLAGEIVTYVRLSRVGELSGRWITVSLSPWRDSSGDVQGIVLVSMQVHDLKTNAEALRAANERLTSHIDNSPLAMIELDNNLSVANCSTQFRSLLGLDADVVVGAPILDVLAAASTISQVAPLADAFSRLQSGVETRNRVEVALRHSSGATVHSEWFNSALTDAHGGVNSIMSLVQDATARTLAEARLLEIAMRDPLTGLGNRRALTDRIEETLRSADGRAALLLIDLDGFKPINDTYGHAVGDEVLCEVARRLTDIAHAEDTVARIGGDEFVLLVADERLRQANRTPAQIATHIMQSLEAPYVIEQMQLQLSASIGVAECPPVAPDVVELIRRADTAMYAAKRAGKANVRFAQDHVTNR